MPDRKPPETQKEQIRDIWDRVYDMHGLTSGMKADLESHHERLDKVEKSMALITKAKVTVAMGITVISTWFGSQYDHIRDWFKSTLN